MALADKVTQFNTDADLAHQIIHGPASGAGSTVTTEGGDVRSFAKLQADLAAGVSGSASAAAASATAAANSATAAAASAAAANAVVTGVSVVRHSLRPSLLLAFSLMGGKMDPRVVVSRPSAGGRFNSRGLYESIAANRPRFDHDPVTQKPLGLLVEEQRTNLLTYSERFDNAAWTKTAKVIPGATVAPDGSMTGTLAEQTASSQYLVASFSVAAGDTTTRSFSLFLKQGTAAQTSLSIVHYSGGTSNFAQAIINWATKSVTQSGDAGSIAVGLKDVGNGWYRLHVVGANNGGANTAFQATIYPSHTATGYAYIWGAQLEAGAFATSYISSTTTFTSRASAGSFTGSNGLVQSAASNVARMQYNPLDLYAPAKLLLEAAATNLITYSEQFDNAAWTKVNATVTTNAVTSPDGAASADKLVEDTANSTHFAVCGTLTVAAGTYTSSIYVKASERARCVLHHRDSVNTNYAAATFDLTAGTVAAPASIVGSGFSGASAKIENVGNGWYRCSITATHDGTISGLRLWVRLHNGTSDTYTGDGTSGLYVWGAQLEAGSFATSYIATTSAQVTRAADVSSSAQTTRSADAVSMPTSSAWFNQNEGTLYTEADVNALGTTNKWPWLSRLDDGSNSNAIGTFIADPVSDQVYVVMRVGGVHQVDQPTTVTATPGALIKAAIGYKANDSALSISGSSVISDTDCRVPVVNRLFIGNGDYPLNGHVKRIAYYPRRISAAELQGLTQQ